MSYIVFNFLLPVAEGLQRMVRSRVCRGTVLAIRRGSVSLCFGSSYMWRKQHWEIRIMAQIYRALKYQCRSWDQAMLMLNSKLNFFLHICYTGIREHLLMLLLASHDWSLHLLDRKITFAFVNTRAASVLELRLELRFGPVVHGTSECSEVNSNLSKRRTCEQPQWG